MSNIITGRQGAAIRDRKQDRLAASRGWAPAMLAPDGGMHRDYDLWDISGQWNYERGRAWATLTPRHIQLRRAGKITSEALAWFKSCGDDII